VNAQPAVSYSLPAALTNSELPPSTCSAGRKSGKGGAATTGPSATWVAVQHPAKKRKSEAGTALPAGGQQSDGEEAGPASPTKAGRAEVLSHNAAVKADGKAMAGQRFDFLDRHLQVRLAWLVWRRLCLAAVFALPWHVWMTPLSQCPPFPVMSRVVGLSQVLRPFISADVAAAIRTNAAEARAAGLPPMPAPVEVQPGGQRCKGAWHGICAVA